MSDAPAPNARESRDVPPPHGHDRTLPGLALVGALALAAMILRFLPLPGVALVSPLVAAYLLGILARPLVARSSVCDPGLDVALRPLLRAAIVLLGLQITLGEILEVGAVGLAVLVVVSAACFALTRRLGRALGIDAGLATLIAAGTSICGAAAIVAVNTVTRAGRADVGYALACVTALGSLGILLYPPIGLAFGLDALVYGLWAGGSLHEVAQAVAAGYQYGTAAGDAAVVAKLVRVLGLAPLVILLAWSARRAVGSGDAPTVRVPVPWFAFGFVAVALANSALDLPLALRAALFQATLFLLAMALAAMGLRTDLGAMRARGARPLLLAVLAWLFVAVASLAALAALA